MIIKKTLMIKTFLTLFILFFSYSALAEIKDKRIYNNFYDTCMEERVSDFSIQEQSTYCSCSGKKVMKEFTIKELILLEADLIQVNEDEQIKIALANDKLLDIFVSCFSEIFE